MVGKEFGPEGAIVAHEGRDATDSVFNMVDHGAERTLL